MEKATLFPDRKDAKKVIPTESPKGTHPRVSPKNMCHSTFHLTVVKTKITKPIVAFIPIHFRASHCHHPLELNRIAHN
jgi:hypothetical protein